MGKQRERDAAAAPSPLLSPPSSFSPPLEILFHFCARSKKSPFFVLIFSVSPSVPVFLSRSLPVLPLLPLCSFNLQHTRLPIPSVPTHFRASFVFSFLPVFVLFFLDVRSINVSHLPPKKTHRRTLSASASFFCDICLYFIHSVLFSDCDFFFSVFWASTSKALPPPARGMKFRGSNQVLTESVSVVVLVWPKKNKRKWPNNCFSQSE